MLKCFFFHYLALLDLIVNVNFKNGNEFLKKLAGNLWRNFFFSPRYNLNTPKYVHRQTGFRLTAAHSHSDLLTVHCIHSPKANNTIILAARRGSKRAKI